MECIWLISCFATTAEPSHTPIVEITCRIYVNCISRRNRWTICPFTFVTFEFEKMPANSGGAYRAQHQIGKNKTMSGHGGEGKLKFIRFWHSIRMRSERDYDIYGTIEHWAHPWYSSHRISTIVKSHTYDYYAWAKTISNENSKNRIRPIRIRIWLCVAIVVWKTLKLKTILLGARSVGSHYRLVGFIHFYCVCHLMDI